MGGRNTIMMTSVWCHRGMFTGTKATNIAVFKKKIVNLWLYSYSRKEGGDADY